MCLEIIVITIVVEEIITTIVWIPNDGYDDEENNGNRHRNRNSETELGTNVIFGMVVGNAGARNFHKPNR